MYRVPRLLLVASLVDRACRPAAGAASTRSVRTLDRRHPRSTLQRRRRLGRSPSRSTFPTTPSGVLTGTFSQPEQGVKGLPLSNVSREGHTVSFEIKANGGGLFKGTQADATSISGEFVTTQGGYNVPFDLKRTGDARVAAGAEERADRQGTGRHLERCDRCGRKTGTARADADQSRGWHRYRNDSGSRRQQCRNPDCHHAKGVERHHRRRGRRRQLHGDAQCKRRAGRHLGAGAG